ncbi:MAG: CBS domain-containing protein [Desulfonatronovibrio sp.]
MKNRQKGRIMTTHVYCIEPDQSLLDAVMLMKNKNISCLPVVRGEAAIGILTERDLAKLMLKTGHNLEGYLVRDIMSSRVITISEDTELFSAYSQMCGNRIRHLIVTDKRGCMVGVKTFTDLMADLGREYLSEVKTVADVMSRDIVTIVPEGSVGETLRLMTRQRISCIPVVEHGCAVGIITERDLVSKLAGGGPDMLGWAVDRVMSSPVHSVDENMYAFDAVSMMNDLGVRRFAVADEEGRLKGLITQTDMVATLIKRHANLEFMVRKRTRQLTRKSEELEFSNQQLRRVDEIKSAFLSSVSHELRTPLTSLLGFAKITGKTFARHFVPLAGNDKKLNAQAEKIMGNLDILVQEGQRMTRLINDFLDLTKIEADKIEWNDKMVQVSDFVLHAGHSLRAQFEGKEDVDLRIMVEDNLPLVYVDVDRMLQVMINLLSNAAKFTSRGNVTVEAVNIDNEFVEVRVSDTGPGISDQEIDKIFDKFHQLEKRGQGEEIKGTGLGLAICKEIVEHYKGRIWVESEFGKGSSFKFRIPAAGLPSRDDSIAPEIRKPVKMDSGAPLVLAVDDSPAIRDYLQQLFADEGFRVITEPDGSSALITAEKLLPQCIIMDLMMPGMDGAECLRLIRENSVTKDIPVTILSAYPSRAVKGTDAALAKPVDEALLVQTVRGLIHGGRIQGRKCILVPNVKPEKNMLMISAGKLRYIKPEELNLAFKDKFSGTVFLPGKEMSQPAAVEKISRIDDVLVMIMPEDEK